MVGEDMNGVFDPVAFLFWLLLFVTILWPHLQYRNLKAARLSVIRLIEKRYKCRVVTMIHRQERVGIFNIPFYRFIDIEDSEAVVRAIRSTPPDTPIMLILHTPGGLVLAASQIAFALKRHPAKKIVVIPHYAMSGGTLIALAADEIWMDPNAVLGPLDPQLTAKPGIAVPAPSVLRVVREKGVEKVSDETLMLADMAEKAIRQMKGIVIELLEDKMSRDKAEKIAEELVSGKYTHDYPITVDEAVEMGLPVKPEIPVEVYELMELYPQAHIQRPGVEYIPYPYAPPYPHPQPARRQTTG